eukprot:SAG31_NODE_4463_length_3213_cov_2.754978_2_plen_65_part_00
MSAATAALQLPPGVSSGRGKWLAAAMGAARLLGCFDSMCAEVCSCLQEAMDEYIVLQPMHGRCS